MKIIHVINRCSIANGAAKLLLDLIPYQISQGHDVRVLALGDVTPSYKDHFEQIGCKYEVLLKEGKSLLSVSLLFLIKNKISSYDIVHAHLFPSFYWVALIKLLFNTKYKLVYTEHSPENNRRRKWLLPIERLIYRKYNAIIAISDIVKENLLNFLKIDLPIYVIFNGINNQLYERALPINKTDINIPQDSFIITQVSRFGPEKDQMTLIQTMKLLPENIHLVLVGHGPLYDKHIKTVNQLHLENRIHFLGIRNDIPQILKMSDIVVLSSHFEGFGLAAVEGMAARKPVIASNVPGLQNVVHGAGLLFEKYDTIQLKNHILKLIKDKRFYDEIAYQCYNRSLKFEIRQVAKEYEQIYNNLFNE